MHISCRVPKATDTHPQYVACTFHAGYLRLQTHTHNMVHAHFMLDTSGYRHTLTIWCMHISCWLPQATDTHSQYVKLTALHYNNSCTNATQRYVISTLAVLLLLSVGGTLWAADSKL